jgi:hypothetical protein
METTYQEEEDVQQETMFLEVVINEVYVQYNIMI